MSEIGDGYVSKEQKGRKQRLKKTQFKPAMKPERNERMKYYASVIQKLQRELLDAGITSQHKQCIVQNFHILMKNIVSWYRRYWSSYRGYPYHIWTENWREPR